MQVLDQTKQHQLTSIKLIIDPLKAGWDTPIEKNHFRSGNGPIEAIECGCKLLQSKQTDLVVISGEGPAKEWFDFITKLFRGVDCANPVMDYAGTLVLASDKAIEKLNISPKACIEIKGVATEKIAESTPDIMHKIAEYSHLKNSYQQACAQANINFADLFKKQG